MAIATEEVGKDVIAVEAPLPAVAAFTKVDNNLTGIGYFTASSKRSRKATEKITVIVDEGVEHRISILPSAKYGLPITQDQDFWLALMKLASDHVQQEGKLNNPFTFTTAQLTKMLGQAHSGKNYKAVEEWLSVMAFTGVEGGAYNAARKTWYTEKTHALDRVVTVGKKLPDGTTADKNYIWFSQWQLDNINAGNLIAIELNTYTQLETNIARNLVPHLQEWLFASQRQGRFEKQYENLCQLLGIRVYRYVSDIERKLGPSLDELVNHGYISKWAIEPMTTRKGYKIVLWHGRKYHRDRQARLDRHPSRKAAQEQLLPGPERKPRHLQPEVDPQVMALLSSRGVTDTPGVRKLVTELPADFPIIDTLEYGDSQASLPSSNITNRPGFYISLLRNQIRPPATFTSSRLKKAQEEANLREQQALKEAVAKATAEENQLGQRGERRLAVLTPQQLQLLSARFRAELVSERPFLARQPEGSQFVERVVRARLVRYLAQEPMELLVVSQSQVQLFAALGFGANSPRPVD